MDGTAELMGFAYGEHLEEGSGRSLGYRLLAPVASAPWSDEVEALARRLQAAPYPDTWPAVDLFCSVLLSDGQRVVAQTRYGLADHTAARRRGGLDLVGVVAPAGLGVNAALAIYRWLGQRRAEVEDLHQMGGRFRLADVLTTAPPELPPRPDGTSAPVPVLPVRLWQEGAFLFAAAAPGDPNLHLRLLENATTAHWQWLPLVGPDFPLPMYAQRGPLIAWTPHLAGVAVRLDRGSVPVIVPARPETAGSVGRWLAGVLSLLFIGLLGANLWYMQGIQRDLAALNQLPTPTPKEEAKRAEVRVRETDESRERFARALHRLVTDRGGPLEKQERSALLERYQTLARRYPDLALSAENEEGQLAVAAAGVYAGRGTGQIDEVIRRALTGKGFSEKLIQAARDQVREELAREGKER